MAKTEKSDVIIVGSGAAGGTIARELSRAGKKVLILERGPKIKEITDKTLVLQKGAYEKTIITLPGRLSVLYDKKGLFLSKENVYIYRSLLVGGTSMVSTGNAVRSLYPEFRKMGIDLGEYFEKAEKDLFVTHPPQKIIGECTRQILKAAEEIGIKMKPMPKCVNFDKCDGCGPCVFGCPKGAIWTSSMFLHEAMEKGARVLPEVNVREVITKGGRAAGVRAEDIDGEVEFYGDVIILAAGGIGTPLILKASGIEDAGRGLFVGLCRNTCGIVDRTGLTREYPVPAFYDDMLEEKGFLLTPVSYPDPVAYVVDCDERYYSDLGIFNMARIQRRAMSLKRDRVLAIMTKTKDESNGVVSMDGSISKGVTPEDMEKLDRGAELAKKILIQAGCDPETIFNGKIAGAHPGGTAAMAVIVTSNFETKKIKDLFVCDASVFPASAGAQPILTIVALAKYFAGTIK